MREKINIYCDESCHLENDGHGVMALGGIVCPQEAVKRFSVYVRNLKEKHKLKTAYESKWTKISKGQSGFYLDLLQFFIDEPSLCFRGVLIPNKGILAHEDFKQSHDDFYYKMYYCLLKYIFKPENEYYVYLDLKDTRGGHRTKKLQEVLANNLHDFNFETVRRVQQIRSHESELLQLADVLIGALTYHARGLQSSTAKNAVIQRLLGKFGDNLLTRSSPFVNKKFNLLVWPPNEGNL